MLFNLFNKEKERSIPEPSDTWTDEETIFVKECMEAKKSISEIHQKLYEKFNSYHSADAINLKISDIERQILENSYQSTENPVENNMQSTDSNVDNENESENDLAPVQTQLDLGLESQPKLTYTISDLARYVYSLSKDDATDDMMIRLKSRIRRVIKSYKDVQTKKMRTSQYESSKRCYTFPSLDVLEQFASDVRTKFPCTDATQNLIDSIKSNKELFKGDKLFFSARDIMAFVVQQPKNDISLSTQYLAEYYYIANTLNQRLNIKDRITYDQVRYYSLTPSLVLEFVNKLKHKYANIASSKELKIEDIIEYANNLAVNNNGSKINSAKASDMYTKIDLDRKSVV